MMDVQRLKLTLDGGGRSTVLVDGTLPLDIEVTVRRALVLRRSRWTIETGEDSLGKLTPGCP